MTTMRKTRCWTGLKKVRAEKIVGKRRPVDTRELLARAGWQFGKMRRLWWHGRGIYGEGLSRGTKENMGSDFGGTRKQEIESAAGGARDTLTAIPSFHT
ncbi:hypothetical protein ACLOJK_036155 [Asimina triloba]